MLPYMAQTCPQLPYMAQTCPQNILSNIKQILAGYLNSKARVWIRNKRTVCFMERRTLVCKFNSCLQYA
jgi:hypothetical protein